MTSPGTASYLAASTLTAVVDRSDLTLETALGATPLGLVQHPQFFTGFLARPEVAAAGLLAVADVASSRYFDLAALQQRSLDPVVTASGDRLRFESFSACNGVYARLDLLADGIDTGEVAFGTTNVDINQPLRTALAGIARDALVHVAVGDDALHVATVDQTHVERKVTMPGRWLRGFAETPVVAHRMRQRAELPPSPGYSPGSPKGRPDPPTTSPPPRGGCASRPAAPPAPCT